VGGVFPNIYRIIATCLLILADAPAWCQLAHEPSDRAAGEGIPSGDGQITVIDRDAHYPEGPLWRDGKLLYVEYSTSTIKSWSSTRSGIFWHKEGCGPSSLISRGGALLVACYDGNYLVQIDGSGREVRILRTDSGGSTFTGPNDFAADDRGGVYFSASGAYDIKAPITGAVLYLRADGRTITQVASTLHYPNGLALTNDRRHLLVSEMLAGRVLSFPIEDQGMLGPRTVWARLQDLATPTPHEDAYNGPDGLKLGLDGNYYIAQNGSGRLLVVNEDRKLVRIISVPTPYVTNVAFDPHRPDVIFVTGAFEQWKPPYPGAVYEWTR
jgi:gluconolactonase